MIVVVVAGVTPEIEHRLAEMIEAHIRQVTPYCVVIDVNEPVKDMVAVMLTHKGLWPSQIRQFVEDQPDRVIPGLASSAETMISLLRTYWTDVQGYSSWTDIVAEKLEARLDEGVCRFAVVKGIRDKAELDPLERFNPVYVIGVDTHDTRKLETLHPIAKVVDYHEIVMNEGAHRSVSDFVLNKLVCEKVSTTG